MTNGKNDPVTLDMSFDEALERFSKTEPSEVLEVRKESMSEDTIESLIDSLRLALN